MTSGFKKSISIFAVLAATAAASPAQASSKIELKITQEKEVPVAKHSKQMKLVPTDKVTPGDVVQYTLSYVNTGDQKATNAVVNDPIPQGTIYIGDTATGENADIAFSRDGGKTYADGPSLTYDIDMPDGTIVKRVVTPDQYTNIRWTIKELPAGASGKVTFKVKVG